MQCGLQCLHLDSQTPSQQYHLNHTKPYSNPHWIYYNRRCPSLAYHYLAHETLRETQTTKPRATQDYTTNNDNILMRAMRNHILSTDFVSQANEIAVCRALALCALSCTPFTGWWRRVGQERYEKKRIERVKKNVIHWSESLWDKRASPLLGNRFRWTSHGIRDCIVSRVFVVDYIIIEGLSFIYYESENINILRSWVGYRWVGDIFLNWINVLRSFLNRTSLLTQFLHNTHI